MKDRLRAVECPANIIDQILAGVGRVLERAMVKATGSSSYGDGWVNVRYSFGVF